MALHCESRQRQSMVRRRSATVWQCFEARRYATARCGRETPGGGRVSTEKKRNAMSGNGYAWTGEASQRPSEGKQCSAVARRIRALCGGGLARNS